MKDELAQVWNDLTELMKRDLVYLDRHTSPSHPRVKVVIDCQTAEALECRGLVVGDVGWRITAKGVQVASHRNDRFKVPSKKAMEHLSKGIAKVGVGLGVDLNETVVARALNRDYKQARKLQDRVWEKTKELQEAVGQAGMIGIIWTREVGPVDTVLSDHLGDALEAFTEGSGVQVLITERREGEAIRPCQFEAMKAFFPELDIKMKPTPRERCPVCSGLTQGGRADVGNLCECSYCDQCDAPYEDKWTDDNGNALCPKCRDAQAAGTVWKCDGCGALFNDQGLDPGLALVTVSGMWTRENGKWTHYCPEPNRRVSEVTKVK